MDNNIIAVVWPRPEDYLRFLEVCGPGQYPDTYVEFVQHILAQMAQRGIDPSSIEKVHVVPDEMREWCIRHHGKVDAKARAAFAMFKVQSRYGKDGQTIN